MGEPQGSEKGTSPSHALRVKEVFVMSCSYRLWIFYCGPSIARTKRERLDIFAWQVCAGRISVMVCSLFVLGPFSFVPGAFFSPHFRHDAFRDRSLTSIKIPPLSSIPALSMSPAAFSKFHIGLPQKFGQIRERAVNFKLDFY